MVCGAIFSAQERMTLAVMIFMCFLFSFDFLEDTEDKEINI